MRAAASQVQLREIERGEAPIDLRGFASPTVLVAGQDVAAATPCATQCGGKACRVYEGTDGRSSGAPRVDQIVAALQRAQPSSTARSRSAISSPV